MNINELNTIKNEFLNRWPVEKVRNISLEEYSTFGENDTFSNWVENKIGILGSSGISAFKFGIFGYNTNIPNYYTSRYLQDEKYSWEAKFGNNRSEVFKKVKKEIVSIIEFIENGKISEIEDLNLNSLYRWNIAFLYSNERLIPFYSVNSLYNIAHDMGYKGKKRISEMQNFIVQNKPALMSVFEYRQLYDNKGIKNIINEKFEPFKIENGKRKPAIQKNTETQIKIVSSCSIVEQKHNKLQTKLYEKLIKEYGSNNVLLEENFVDIKLLQSHKITFFEVKSASYASECIKELLGQLLSYCYKDNDKRSKKIVVAGQFPPTNKDIEFINFIKSIINIEFEYISIDLS